MKAHELSAIGKEIYGDRWRIPLAEALDVDTRTVRNWLNGTHKINERTARSVRALLAEKKS